jgi:lysophospholipase L1-like esterase
MKFIVTILLALSALVLQAQDKPFWKEIRNFKSQDSIQMPPKNAIVFVGSSSFRLWKDVESAFPGHVIINRGFGGSSLPHVIDYADQIVVPYKPKQVVIYCGENDFTKEGVTSEMVLDRFVTLFDLLRKELPKAEIIYVSMKPSPSRQHLWGRIKAANEAIEAFLKTKKKTKYVNIWDAMLDANGEARKELYVQDMLHMNASGYEIWQKALAPHLK